MFDPITEDDLHAYVDDQLDATRRIEVEEHLAHNPEAAARVMADLSACPMHPSAVPLPSREGRSRWIVVPIGLSDAKIAHL